MGCCPADTIRKINIGSRWTTFVNVWPTLSQHWFNILCLLGDHNTDWSIQCGNFQGRVYHRVWLTSFMKLSSQQNILIIFMDDKISFITLALFSVHSAIFDLQWKQKIRKDTLRLFCYNWPPTTQYLSR